jgi:hypothetical protein
MSYRPYPSRDRALRLILRRYRNELPPELLARVRVPQQEPHFVGQYVLSTRRPGAVGGGA